MELRHKKAGKVARPKRSRGGGIKAIIPCPVLRRLVIASKRWYAFTKISDGEEAAERSALASAIPVAEAVLKKFERRNYLAFESRERKRASEGAQGASAERRGIEPSQEEVTVWTPSDAPAAKLPPKRSARW